MNKFYDTLTNTRGESLPGYRVQVVDSAQAIVSIYEDASGTPFTDSEGNIVNYSVAGETGEVAFYWTPQDDQELQVLDVDGNLSRPPITDFADSYLAGDIPSTIPQSSVIDLESDLATLTSAVGSKADAVGTTAALATKTASADLAADAGASVVGTSDGGTVQHFIDTQEGVAVFDVGAYLTSALLEQVQSHDAAQDQTAVTTAIRTAFDEALAYLQGGTTRGASVRFPAGGFYVNNELLSDSFQEDWWNQTNIRKQNFLTVEGVPGAGTIIYVGSEWISGVRNTANGNERTYGPWANEPSPAAVFPTIANKNAATPAAFSLRHLRLVGTDTVGVDPIPWLAMNELDARSEGLHVAGFANWGEVVMGSFNSLRAFNHWEGCGAQPVESGALAGGDAGFPENRIYFDYVASTNTLSAKAKEAFGSYAVDDPVPYFIADNVGKTIAIHQGDAAGGGQPLLATIATIVSGNASITVTPLGSVTDQDATNTAASFLPVTTTTTAASAQVTLSAPVKWGRGAADMVGQLVCIPKAGSTTDSDLDLLTSRIISCDTGSDADGYTVVTLADAAANSVAGEPFIMSSGHGCLADEGSLASNFAWNVNDTDFIQCRWEQSGGYGADVSAAAPQFIVQNAGESAQYVSCKIHGCNTLRGQFAAETNCIVDASKGLFLVNSDFTHFSYTGKGVVRFMGGYQRARITADIGSWQQPYNWSAIYLDPQAGYDPDLWNVADFGGIMPKNDLFPRASQLIWGRDSGLTEYDALSLRKDTRLEAELSSVELGASDDLNDVNIAGNYHWGTPPANAPGNAANNSVLRVQRAENWTLQEIVDLDNDYHFTREKFGGSWSGWRHIGPVRASTTGALNDAGNQINVTGKASGVMARNTTDNKIYVATGSVATDTWISADGATTLTPS